MRQLDAVDRFAVRSALKSWAECRVVRRYETARSCRCRRESLRTNDDEISTRREFTLEVLTDHLVYSLWLKMDFRYCFVIAVSLRCIRDAA
jgi:hypothetical protein